MKETSILPNYDEVAEALSKADSPFDAAQVHGLFCGLITGDTEQQNGSLWKKVLTLKKRAKSFEILEELYEASYHLLSEFSFEFTILLPEDSMDINKRAEALGLWCQGYLSGLEQFDPPVQPQLGNEAADAFEDIIEMAQVSYGDITTNEEDEAAYFELVEHLRMSVLLIYQDLRSMSADNYDERDLH